MAYGTLLTDTIKSSTSGPVAFQNTSGTEIGTLCRAWVNFNGTGTVAIRASFNVSSITDNGTGDYTINFTNAMPDANYAANVTTSDSPTINRVAVINQINVPTTSAVRIYVASPAGSLQDQSFNCVTVFR